MTKTIVAFGVAFACAALASAPGARAADAVHIERQDWSFTGFGGGFQPGQLQRGFQVYQERCSSCHGLKRVSFRNLSQPGGPEFPEESVKALAAAWPNKPLETNDEGKTVEREPTLADPLLGPYRNAKEARAAQNGALPPDLSLITKARGAESQAAFYVQPFTMLRDIATGFQEGGADYVYSVLTGYKDAPEGFALTEGMYYNTTYPGHQIAMPAPLAADNFVAYQDGAGSLEQNTKDVVAFLSWAGDPHLEQRKTMGWQVMLYLLITTVLLYLVKSRMWAKTH